MKTLDFQFDKARPPFCLPRLLSQHHQSGCKNPETRHHVCAGLPGGGKPHENPSARQAGEAVRRGHQRGAHLHHHGVHGQR